MRFLTAFALLVACASAYEVDEWMSYKAKHGKLYEGVEDRYRQVIYLRNKKLVAKHNEEADSGVHTYRLGMNRFADMTNQEFVRLYNGYNATRDLKRTPGHKFVVPRNAAIPESVDWRTQGYVTPVKDQGQCGSCWAFSAVAGLEGQHFATTGKLVSLSEQNLVDCSTKQGNQGCDGGLMDQAFEYVIKNNGIDTEASYSYSGKDGVCKFTETNVGATCTGYTDIKSGSEEELTAACGTVGPISVAIDASELTFQLYTSGIYKPIRCSTTALDHGVTVVGYDSLGQGKDYYIVKNSWGVSWGQKGYIWMARNNKNQCGIATQASYPLV